MNYDDRYQAGRVLADSLKDYAKRTDVIILALPRGGVPVGYEIANKLSLPLDIFIVRKLGVPGHEELAMGAIASGEVTVFNDEIVNMLHIQKDAIKRIQKSEQEELSRRELLYRGQKPFPELTGKTVILVDDGIATGYTMRAAIAALKQKKPIKIIVAVPVAAQSTCDEIASLVDEIICPMRPVNFYAVGLWYNNFSQTTDEEVMELLRQVNTP
ncbi:phosphoribosyltransferase [Fluoribacter dumoffii]|uniref:Orotate phosphoribosyltransferase n=1 Tax=Fluoribacter dumoffii TaxID=463 RepID=A0A377GEJ8_9GAMM|nr:phosphoribosyltransferase [Fluoribacter dumoffii]KTC91062.1 phosphoribosyltransferase [Fluoribacter dumoffii NY 23]MCW8387769.1 phosphoribosyltransferase [Fluoribacter dumoffii]MCW8416673.1 phosphoribosyltransferase [Fluoribacter dumoffii]MCW8455487.1 phosphoribosyltransferase [Fluoribacter dumoffii]MCW8460434.1 phosphoribosyltransferase [Fluoribacter dumoffii]